MVICKEIDYYLKYAEEHPNWINKKRKLLFENIVKAVDEAGMMFFLMKKHIGIVLSIVKVIITNYSRFKSSFMHLHLCTKMIFRFFPRFS